MILTISSFPEWLEKMNKKKSGYYIIVGSATRGLFLLTNNEHCWPTVVIAKRRLSACKSAWVTAKPDP